MKRAIILTAIAIAVAFTAASGTGINGQTPKRIQFAKGRNSAVLRGTTAKFGAAYILRARSGQKLVIDISPASGVGVKVETVGRYGEMVLLREKSGGRYEIGLEETGDYTIFIGPLGRNPLTYTLTVSVTKLTDI